jgi:hypothetical protein
MKELNSNLRLRVGLSIGLVMSIGCGVHQWFLVQQDEEIAPREQNVRGTVYEVIHGKGYTAHYSFTYEGQQYFGSETTGPDQSVRDTTIYFDPTDPSTNTLTEYRIKREKDHSTMFYCGYASVGLAAALAFAWKFKDQRGSSAQTGSTQNS